ncbi:MAG: Holliday junction resolvase [Thermoplasmatales archaeon]
MAVNGSVYERELKQILSGDKEKLEELTWIRPDLKTRILERPFMVVRAAGSHGFDIIVLRGDISVPIEIKSSRDSTLNFSTSSSRSQQQAENYISLMKKTGVMPLYAFRRKAVTGDPWRFFTFDYPFEGKYRIFSEIIPKIETTKNGSFVLKWEKGLSLTSLLEYLF